MLHFKHQKIKDMDNPKEALSLSSKTFIKALLQWTPTHSNTERNEKVDKMAKKKRERMQETDRSTTYK